MYYSPKPVETEVCIIDVDSLYTHFTRMTDHQDPRVIRYCFGGNKFCNLSPIKDTGILYPKAKSCCFLGSDRIFHTHLAGYPLFLAKKKLLLHQ